MRIDVIVFEGFDELDAIGPFEILANAAKGGADADVALTTLKGDWPPRGFVEGSHGVAVRAHRELGLPGEVDLVLVPGGGWNDRAASGARAEAERGEIAKALIAHHRAGATLASVCTGGMLLATAGLLDGRPAITHHGAIAELAQAGAIVTHERVVDDGDIVTAGGVTSGLDLALHVVRRYWGAALAEAIAAEMEHPR